MQFVAIPPSDLFSIARSKLENAEKDALPELKAMNRGREYKVRVASYEGFDGIKEMYNIIFREAKDAPQNVRSCIGFYAHGQEVTPEYSKFVDELIGKFKKRSLKRRGITVADKTIAKYLAKEFQKNNLVELKGIIPAKYNSNISIEVYRNKTYIFSQKNMHGTVIDNPDVARVMKQIFELVWERNDGIFVDY
jgi:hypothetical protein